MKHTTLVTLVLPILLVFLTSTSHAPMEPIEREPVISLVPYDMGRRCPAIMRHEHWREHVLRVTPNLCEMTELA